MTRFLRILTVVSVVALAACTEIAPEGADSPLGPRAQMSESEAAPAAAPALSVSTTCQSFRNELDAVSEQLSQNADDAELQQKQAALAAIVADVCN